MFTPGLPPVSANPFGDLPAGSAAPSNIQNPYASPTGYVAQQAQLSTDEVRSKLLGPAIGISLSAVLSLGFTLLMTIMLAADESFRDEFQGENAAETAGAYFAAIMMFAFAVLPPLVSLVGAYAMFRGRGLVAAWIGAFATLIPCTPCFFIGAIFAVWGMIALADSRVSKGML
ncbi:hypothetical protein [Anatilimnocola aggregata]|nr:hypothetical protein [Anatilimnocola aggregata]